MIYRKIKIHFGWRSDLSINAEWAICLAVEAGKLIIERLLRTTMSVEYNHDLLRKTLLEKLGTTRISLARLPRDVYLPKAGTFMRLSDSVDRPDAFFRPEHQPGDLSRST